MGKKSCSVCIGFVLSFFGFFVIGDSLVGASETLTLDSYLNQVKKNHSGFKGATLGEEGGEKTIEQGKFLTTPAAFVSFQHLTDSKLAPVNFFGFDSLSSETLSVGVSQTTTYGLTAKLHYDIYYQNYNNPQIPVAFQSFNINTAYAYAAPVLEVSQSLWSNGFGRSTKAQQDQLEAQALSQTYLSRFQKQSILVEAEAAFWRLALARQAVTVQKEAVLRAKKIFEYTSRKAHLQLGDRAEALQAEAGLRARELELASTQTEEREASQNFNSKRNIDSFQVLEKLPALTKDVVDRLQIPKRAELRDDLKAAQQQVRSSLAASEILIEKGRPTLDLFGTLALNGQPASSAGFTPFTNLGSAMGASFSFNRPTASVGLRFSIPLDIPLTLKVRDGLRAEETSAELSYDRKVFEQDQGWKLLNEKLSEAKKHLALALQLESLQQDKLEHERSRLNRGRTTTYQVLLFEQDYLLAQLMRVRDQANVLNIVAQMKLFGENL